MTYTPDLGASGVCGKRYIDSLYFIYKFTYFNKAKKGLRPTVCPAFCHVQKDKH